MIITIKLLQMKLLVPSQDFNTRNFIKDHNH